MMEASLFMGSSRVIVAQVAERLHELESLRLRGTGEGAVVKRRWQRAAVFDGLVLWSRWQSLAPAALVV